MPEPLTLTLTVTLPLAQVEPLLRYLQAYPDDPQDAVRCTVALDARDQLSRDQALTLVDRLGFRVVAVDDAARRLTGVPRQEDTP